VPIKPNLEGKSKKRVEKMSNYNPRFFDSISIWVTLDCLKLRVCLSLSLSLSVCVCVCVYVCVCVCVCERACVTMKCTLRTHAHAHPHSGTQMEDCCPFYVYQSHITNFNPIAFLKLEKERKKMEMKKAIK